MKIITLVENNSCSDNLQSEHGLSLYIETEKHKILFDTGKTDLFIQNAKKLNIDIKEVDTVVISHGHYDHIGGLIHFLKLNDKADIFLKKQIFDFNYFSVRDTKKKYIGFLPELLDYKHRFFFIESACCVFDDLIFITNFDRKYPLPKANKMLFKEQNKKLVNDNFNHELMFLIRKNDDLSVFSGCAHNGILNTVSTAQRFLINKKIKNVIGGFHLFDNNEFTENETESEIQFIAEELKRITPYTNYYTGHCTGKIQFNTLSEILKSNLIKINTGSLIEM